MITSQRYIYISDFLGIITEKSYFGLKREKKKRKERRRREKIK
jgi:hypothetical protein